MVGFVEAVKKAQDWKEVYRITERGKKRYLNIEQDGRIRIERRTPFVQDVLSENWEVIG